MKRRLILVVLLLLCGMLAVGCPSQSNRSEKDSRSEKDPQIQVSETGNQASTMTEAIYINNCGGKAETKYTAERSLSVDIGVGGGVTVGRSLIEGSISAKYEQHKSGTGRLELIAPPGTNMEFTLRWTDQEWIGKWWDGSQSGTYNVHVPVTVQQASKDLGGCTGGPQPSQGRFLVNVLSSKCIDAKGKPGLANETPLQLWDCELSDPATDQRWELTSDGRIRSTLSRKCIDVKGRPGRANETPLQLWDCEYSDPSTDQKWEITIDGFVRNILSGKCIDAKGKPGRDNETPLQLWDCEFSDPATDQRWIWKSSEQ